jgi:hypothetical protein
MIDLGHMYGGSAEQGDSKLAHYVRDLPWHIDPFELLIDAGICDRMCEPAITAGRTDHVWTFDELFDAVLR